MQFVYLAIAWVISLPLSVALLAFRRSRRLGVYLLGAASGALIGGVLQIGLLFVAEALPIRFHGGSVVLDEAGSLAATVAAAVTGALLGGVLLMRLDRRKSTA